jgi:hypothetical protein
MEQDETSDNEVERKYDLNFRLKISQKSSTKVFQNFWEKSERFFRGQRDSGFRIDKRFEELVTSMVDEVSEFINTRMKGA